MALVLQAFLILALGPSALWLGARYWSWLEGRERSAHAPHPSELGPIMASMLGTCRCARIASVAVVDDELLIQLETVDRGAGTPAVYWLNARVDAVPIEATERCCVERALIQYCVTDTALVLLDVGGTIVPMLGAAAQSEPPL